MRELLVDFITSLDGYASGDGWPGFWGLEGPEYLAWLGEQPDVTYLMERTRTGSCRASPTARCHQERMSSRLTKRGLSMNSLEHRRWCSLPRSTTPHLGELHAGTRRPGRCRSSDEGVRLRTPEHDREPQHLPDAPTSRTRRPIPRRDVPGHHRSHRRGTNLRRLSRRRSRHDHEPHLRQQYSAGRVSPSRARAPTAPPGRVTSPGNAGSAGVPWGRVPPSGPPVVSAAMAMTVTAPAPTAIGRRDASLFPTLCLLFFASGACGLVYQQLWLRQLSLVFGVTVYAVATVLAVFFGGLALGSFLAGRWSRGRTGRCTGTAWSRSRSAPRGRDPGRAARRAARLRGLRRRRCPTPSPRSRPSGSCCRSSSCSCRRRCSAPRCRSSSARRPCAAPVSANGSACCTPRTQRERSSARCVAGFWMIGALGIFVVVPGRGDRQRHRRCGRHRLFALVEGDRCESRSPAERAIRHRPGALACPSAIAALLLVVFAVSGFVSIALEVVWFRVLVLYVESDTYAFTIMLAAVLTGIAIGGYVGAAVLHRWGARLAHLAVLELAIALTHADVVRLARQVVHGQRPLWRAARRARRRPALRHRRRRPDRAAHGDAAGSGLPDRARPLDRAAQTAGQRPGGGSARSTPSTWRRASPDRSSPGSSSSRSPAVGPRCCCSPRRGRSGLALRLRCPGPLGLVRSSRSPGSWRSWRPRSPCRTPTRRRSPTATRATGCCGRTRARRRRSRSTRQPTARG